VIELQRTVGQEITLEGAGLHTGESSRLTFRPAPPNTGVVFRVASGEATVEIPAVIENVPPGEPGLRNTSLVRGEVRILTVEHVLAALAGLGVTNCYLDLEGREPPVTDCTSALPYVRALREARIVAQGLPATYYRLGAPLAVRDGDVELLAEPSDEFRLSFEVDYPDPLIGRQTASFAIRPDVFEREIAPARTYVMLQDVAALRERGHAQGGSTESVCVIDAGQLVGGQQFRFPNEIARHKVLDLLGDLALLGMPLRAHVTARRSGHAANTAFTRELARRERRSTRIYPPRAPQGFDIGAILEVMPHRYPLLLVDRIVELDPPRRVVAVKNVTINEPFFTGHFPGHPIMPGVLILEALAQAGGVLLLTSVDEPRGKLVYFSGIDGARFRRPVIPGDQLRLELELVRMKGPICKMHGTVTVGDEKVAEAELMANLVDA